MSDSTPTEDQNGQYIEESSGVERVVVPEAQRAGDIEHQDLASLRAKNVNLHQSGAEQIDAETVSLHQGGAKTINTQTAELNNSGAVTVAADHISLRDSMAVVVAGENIEMQDVGALAVQAGSVTATDVGAGLLITGELSANNNVGIGIGFIGNVQPGANVQVAVDAKSAAVIGIVFAIAFRLLGKVFGRK